MTLALRWQRKPLIDDRVITSFSPYDTCRETERHGLDVHGDRWMRMSEESGNSEHRGWNSLLRHKGKTGESPGTPKQFFTLQQQLSVPANGGLPATYPS